MYHLTTLPLWHVYSFACDRFNWRDGIRYSYMSFCAKSASISLVDFSVDIVASKQYFRWKFKVELKFICAEFQHFSTLSKHDIIILVIVSHGDRSLTSYSTLTTLPKTAAVHCVPVVGIIAATRRASPFPWLRGTFWSFLISFICLRGPNFGTTSNWPAATSSKWILLLTHLINLLV